MINHSFAVLVYGDSPFLSECLNSLKAQTIQSRIYISTSTPSEFITNMARKNGIDVFTTEPGKGIAHDWNFGLNQAQTKYVTLAHQDDLYLPDYTFNCVQASEKFTDTLICFTDYSELVNHKTRSDTLMLRVKRFICRFFMPFERNIKNKTWKKMFLSFGSAIPCPGVMFNRERLGEFQFSPEFSINVDWDAWFRISKMQGRFVHVSKILFKHRIHPGSATSEGIKANLRQSEDLIMFKKFWPLVIARPLARLYARSYRSNKIID